MKTLFKLKIVKSLSMRKTDIIFYWISTGILCLMMILSASMYIFNTEEIAEVFVRLGYPTYILYPLATAKILGVSVILINKSDFLKYLAYAGFFFNTTLAFFAHYMVNDGEQGGATIAMLAVGLSYIYDRKIAKHKAKTSS